jgi:RNA polymerase sigma-70 factor, ECF subfamily
MSIAVSALMRQSVVESEIALMLRVQADLPGAFEELVDRFWTRIFAKFFRQFGDRQEAEDLSQDVFLRLYRNRKRYQPTAQFTTWLFHIARNVARNALRTRRRKPVTPIAILSDDDEHSRFGPFSQQVQSPSFPLERAELADVVRGAVTQLLDRQRTAVELQFQDRSYSEIAAELDMTPKAAKSLLYRARNQLRESLLSYAEGMS